MKPERVLSCCFITETTSKSVKHSANQLLTRIEKWKMNKKQKRMAIRILTVLFLVGITALLIWAIPLAPKKDLVVITKELPKLDGSEGTSTAYCVYYVWDGEQEESPWWVIFQRPFADGTSEWAILEVADVDNIWDIEQFSTAMISATKFDRRWLKTGMHRLQRTRFQKLRHEDFTGVNG